MNFKNLYKRFVSECISFIEVKLKSQKNLKRYPVLKRVSTKTIYLGLIASASVFLIYVLYNIPFLMLLQMTISFVFIAILLKVTKGLEKKVSNDTNFFVSTIKAVVERLKGKCIDFSYLKDCCFVYLGKGYEFKPEHSRKLYDMLSVGLESSFDINSDNTNTGSNQIHNLGKENESDLLIKTNSLNTHTMFFGTTGTGKTKFFILQIMQAILRDEVVVVIDPKADRDLKEQIIECTKLCFKEKQYFELDLNNPDSSKKSFNLLSVCKDECKIAEQIIACVSNAQDNASDGFKSYAQNAIMNTIVALNVLGLELNFSNIKNHLSLDTYFEAIKLMLIRFVASINTFYAYDYMQRVFKGIGESESKLKEELLKYGFSKEYFTNTKSRKKEGSLITDADESDIETTESTTATKKKKSTSKYTTITYKVKVLQKMYSHFIDKYELKGAETLSKKSIECEIEGKSVVLEQPYFQMSKERDPLLPEHEVHRNTKLESLFDQCLIDETYFIKMTNAADGLLNALSQNGFERILNARTSSVDIKDIYENSGILYVSLNSLVNKLRAVSVGKLILSELTSLSSLIYNNDKSLSCNNKRVNIFVDEAGEIVTEELVMLLNKSRGANYALTLATQSYADLCKDAGEYTASKILDNCNNLISCRVNSEQTARLISTLTGNTRKYLHAGSFSQMADVSSILTSFNQANSVREMDDAIFPFDAIMKLPNFEYIAKLSDGRFVKGVFPFLQKLDAKSLIDEITTSEVEKVKQELEKERISECNARNSTHNSINSEKTVKIQSNEPSVIASSHEDNLNKQYQKHCDNSVLNDEKLALNSQLKAINKNTLSGGSDNSSTELALSDKLIKNAIFDNEDNFNKSSITELLKKDQNIASDYLSSIFNKCSKSKAKTKGAKC